MSATKINICIFFILLVCLFGCGQAGVNQKKKHFLHMGNLAFKEKMYGDAIRYYREAIMTDSSFAQAYNNLGIVYFKTGEIDKAINAYDNCLLQDSEFIDGYFNRNNAYFEKGKHKEALQDLRRIEDRYSPRKAIHFSKGLSFFGLKEYDSAEYAFQKALLLDSANIEIYLNLASVNFYKKQYLKARELSQRALQIDKRSADAYNLLGMLAAKKGEYKSAIDYYDLGLGQKSNNAYILNNKGYAFLSLNMMDQALININESLIIHPENPWVYRNKGIYYLKIDELIDAERLLLQSIDMDEKLYLSNWYLGEVYIKMNEPEKACLNFQKSMDLGETEGERAYRQYCR